MGFAQQLPDGTTLLPVAALTQRPDMATSTTTSSRRPSSGSRRAPAASGPSPPTAPAAAAAVLAASALPIDAGRVAAAPGGGLQLEMGPHGGVVRLLLKPEAEDSSGSGMGACSSGIPAAIASKMVGVPCSQAELFSHAAQQQQQQQLHRLAMGTSAVAATAGTEHGLPAAVLVPAGLEGVAGGTGGHEVLRAVPIQFSAVDGSYLLQPGALSRVAVTLPMAPARTSITGLALQPTHQQQQQQQQQQQLQQQHHWLQGQYGEDVLVQTQQQYVEQQQQSAGHEPFDDAATEYEQQEQQQQDVALLSGAEGPVIGSIAGALVQMGRLLPQQQQQLQQVQVMPRQPQQQQQQSGPLSAAGKAEGMPGAVRQAVIVAAAVGGQQPAEQQEVLRLPLPIVLPATAGHQQQQQQGTWKASQQAQQQQQMEGEGDEDMQLDQQQVVSPWPVSTQVHSISPKQDPEIDHCTVDQPALLRNALAAADDDRIFAEVRGPSQGEGPEAAWADSLIGPTPDTHLFRKQWPRLRGRVSVDPGAVKGPEEAGRDVRGQRDTQEGDDGDVELRRQGAAAAGSKGAGGRSGGGGPSGGQQRQQQQQQAKDLIGTAGAGMDGNGAGAGCMGAPNAAAHDDDAAEAALAADAAMVPCVQLQHLSLLEDPSSVQLLAQSLGLAEDVQVAAMNAAKFLR